jgi:hypothetical protein
VFKLSYLKSGKLGTFVNLGIFGKFVGASGMRKELLIEFPSRAVLPGFTAYIVLLNLDRFS